MPGGRVGMPGGGGGRKDILVVQDENDGQTVNAKTRRDPLSPFATAIEAPPEQRRLARRQLADSANISAIQDMHDTSTHLAVFSVEILVQSTQK